MYKPTRLSEGDIRRIVSLVLEQDEDESMGYNSFDYIDAFLRSFKSWLSLTKKVKDVDFPMSYLLIKYSREFVIANNLVYPAEVDEDYSVDRWEMERFGKEIIRKKILRYPSLREQGRFLDRFGRAIQRFITSQNYPTYVNVNLEENRPYQIETNYEIDLVPFLISDDKKKFYKHNLNTNLVDFIKNYLGMEITSPQYGGVEVEHPNIILKGKDEFIKNVINKEIKKKIREISNNTIQRMNLEFESGPRVNLKLVFKYGPTWERRNQIVDDSNKILKDMGFNPEKFKVSRT